MNDAREPVSALDTLDPITDPQLRRGVLDMFAMVQDWIDNDGVDLVVLAARRLACTYELLIKNGMPELTGCLVVSDRYFDTRVSADHLDTTPPGADGANGADIDRPEWSWRHVAVLDDSVVLGTTLSKLQHTFSHERTADGDRPRVRTAAVVVDREQFAPFLLPPETFTALHERDSAAVEDFSTGVVVALFRGGIPFFSDFPDSVEVMCDNADWSKWLSDTDWFVADVTAPLLDDGIHKAIVQIPKDHKVDQVLARLFPHVAALVENFKIRSYIRPADEAQTAVRFVPIAMLRPATPAALDEALGEICSALGEGTCPTPHWTLLEPQAKHRLVQMFASASLIRVAFDPAAVDRTFATTGDGPSIGWDMTSIGLYFGEQVEQITTWFDEVTQHMARTGPFDAPSFRPASLNRPRPSTWMRKPEVLDLLWQQREIIDFYGLPQEPSQGQLTRIGLMFAHGITSIFGFISTEFERPQRAEIAALGSMSAYEDLVRSKENYRVLHQGITLRELTRALIPGRGETSSWSKSCLSLGIDIGNDLGVIVPDTRLDIKRNLVYRCYRMGETATLVDNPLPSAVWTHRWDRVTESSDTFPITSFSTAIATYLNEARVNLFKAPHHGATRVTDLALGSVEESITADDVFRPSSSSRRPDAQQPSSHTPDPQPGDGAADSAPRAGVEGSRQDSAIADSDPGVPASSDDSEPDPSTAGAALEEWAEMVRRVLPGKLVERYEGIVTSVDSELGTFGADLTIAGLSGGGSDSGVAILQVKKVPDDQRDLVRPGARFRWSVYEHRHNPFLDSTSRLRMEAPTRLNLDRLAADARSLSERDRAR